MEMQHVRYFIALSETLNFTRAAERCNVTQPTLTRAIQSLEHELGGPLFYRERANTQLTELGRMMLPYLTQVLEQIDRAKERAKNLGKLEESQLAIGAMCTIGPGMLCGFLGRFRESHPGVELDVVERPVPELPELLTSGKVEIGIFGSKDEPDERLHYLPLFEERFVIVLPPSHRLTAKNAIEGRDLHGEPYVNRKNCEVINHIRETWAARGVKVKTVFRSERDDWVLGMIRAGAGFGLFPEYVVNEPDLVIRPLIEPEFVRAVYLVTVRGRPHSPSVGAFVKDARTHRWGLGPMPGAGPAKAI